MNLTDIPSYLANMKCVIFAGGFGTRMQEETDTRPKPMVIIDGQPILLWIIRCYASQGVRNFVVLCGYKGEMIDEFFKELAGAGMTHNYSRNGNSYYSIQDRGLILDVCLISTGVGTLTAGRLLQAKDFIGSNSFFCTYGDALADINLEKQVEFFLRHQAPNLISVSKQRSRFGEVIFSATSGLMEEFLEKPLMANLVNIGYFILSPEVLDLCEEDKMFEESVLPMLAAKANCSVFQHDGFWQPIDTLRDLKYVRDLASSGNRPWDKE
jgi:glucose-1-phosphate cytidylyltransferase